MVTGLPWERIQHVQQESPVISSFYRSLFAGRLLWKLVASFRTSPELFGLTIDDSNSEPTFRLFDHPDVYVFSNRPATTRGAEQ